MGAVFFRINDSKLSISGCLQYQKYMVGNPCILFGFVFQLAAHYTTCLLNRKKNK
jgi:hypothetical protein